MDFPKSVPGVGLVGGEFVDEDASTGRQGSLIPAAWGNAVTKELLNVLQEADIEPSESDSGQVAAAILKMISEAGGMPRFTPYVWGGRGDAMPEGDTQSSGQQLLDLMYPDMRADVGATQFTCTEAEWQADPYKRVTHWSLGDGVAWMRPPDKNGVQPGNAGAFYGAGSNPAGGKTGTAVIDAMRNIVGRIAANPNSAYQFLGDGPFAESGAFTVEYRNTSGITDAAGHASMGAALNFDASKSLPAGTTTDPITGEFRPRTWYGIWMIRMYGRVVNPGTLDAAGLNARMDMIDARVATLEAGGSDQNVLAVRAASVAYQASSGRARKVSIKGTGSSVIQVASDGANWVNKATVTQGIDMIVPAGWYYRVNGAATFAYWTEG